MSLSTPTDISLLITVPANSPTSPPLVSTERRITPSWNIHTLKIKLEPITGIPTSTQCLRTQSLLGTWISLNDDNALLSTYNLRKGSEIEVQDLRPPGARTNFVNVNEVEKYVMPEEEYEKRDDSVMAWKRKQKLGRFDPKQKGVDELAGERRERDTAEVKKKGVEVGMRCRVNADDGRRGQVRFVGEIEGLGGDKEKGCVWVGIELDEPAGRNDGSAMVEREGKKTEKAQIFECKEKYGVLVRPEKVEVGEQWTVLDDLMDEDMEEI